MKEIYESISRFNSIHILYKAKTGNYILIYCVVRYYIYNIFKIDYGKRNTGSTLKLQQYHYQYFLTCMYH